MHTLTNYLPDAPSSLAPVWDSVFPLDTDTLEHTEAGNWTLAGAENGLESKLLFVFFLNNCLSPIFFFYLTLLSSLLPKWYSFRCYIA